MGRTETRIGNAPEVYDAVDRRLLGMPGPVWTMALWFGASTVVLALALIFPMNPNAKFELRIGVLIYAAAVFVALVVMRGRTPGWFLYLQTGVSICTSWWVVYISITDTGAITSAISLIAVGAYMGWWMPRLVALGFMMIASAGLLIVYASTDRLPLLFIPWLVVCAMSVGLLLAFGTLVAHMKQQMVTDPLTGLLNRSGMVALVDHRGDAVRAVAPRALMVIDLDQFKEINDRDGHLAGDRTLSDFGSALRSVIRPDDIAFRSGGDEFVLILPRTDAAGAEGLAARLRTTIALEWSYGLTDWQVGEDFDTAVARADRLMYEQKAARATSRGAS
ncbi:MAG: GGDEF domain-containing protein [bacterium]|nr:GGDEF domain-containing protein [bacterium]